MEFIGLLWDEVIMRPMINGLALLSDLLFHNFGLSIIVFTILIRLAMIPLQRRQSKSMKKMQELQPRMKAIQDKYKNASPAEKRQQSAEVMRLYREAGVNPVGCLGPVVIQMPIFIGLYRAILRAMPPTPEGMANLAHSFYSWNPVINKVPIDSYFLGIDLVDAVQSIPFPLNFLTPFLVGATMWLQQKMTTGTQKNMDPRQAQTNQMMLWMLPIMFGIFTWQFPSGLALYFLFSNIIGIIIQYYVNGRQPIVLFGRPYLGSAEARAKLLAESGDSGADALALSSDEDLEESDGDEQPSDVHRQNRRRSDRRRSGGSRRRTRRR